MIPKRSPSPLKPSAVIAAIVLALLTPRAVEPCDVMLGPEYREAPEWIEVDLDRAQWHLASRTRTATYARKEYVRGDDTLQDWSEIVVWSTTFGGDADLASAQDRLLSGLRSGCATLETRQLSESESERSFEWWHDGCHGRPRQHEIVRLVAGKVGLHTLAYGRTGELSGRERKRWIERLSQATLRRRIALDGEPGGLERAQLAVWRGEYARAVAELAPLAEQGDSAAQDLYAGLYFEGWGVERDVTQTLRWLEKAATAPNATARYDLARLYDKTFFERDKALSMLRSAAELGEAEAQGHLGVQLLLGQSPDYVEARRWLERSSSSHDDAVAWLGRIHEDGLGVSKSATEAARWYRLAAEQAVPDAQYRLGRLYAMGSGVEQSDREAKKWLTRAVMQGSDEARAYYLFRYGKQTR